MCGTSCGARTAGIADGPGDNAAGPRLPTNRDAYWQEVFHVEDEAATCEDKGGLPWEPLAPRLLQEAQRLAAEGKERPLTATVILASALPFSGVAMFVGVPVLAGDAALQWGARTPVGRTVGHGAQNAVEVGNPRVLFRLVY